MRRSRRTCVVASQAHTPSILLSNARSSKNADAESGVRHPAVKCMQLKLVAQFVTCNQFKPCFVGMIQQLRNTR